MFAHNYAWKTATETYNSVYCYAFAKYYEDAFSKGKSHDHASQYAFEVALYYGNKYSSVEYIAGDEFDIYNELTIEAKLKAWEYCTRNEFADRERFIAIFIKVFVDTFYPPGKNPGLDEEAIERTIYAQAVRDYQV